MQKPELKRCFFTFVQNHQIWCFEQSLSDEPLRIECAHARAGGEVSKLLIT